MSQALGLDPDVVLQQRAAAEPALQRAVVMTWTNLLFIHWRVPPDRLQRLMPPGVEVETFDGSAWIGLVPFEMCDCVFEGFGWVPRLKRFYECNVRTYVRAGGLSGVWFLSLDAQNLVSVIGGRALWNLNYIYSRFDVRSNADAHDYRLRRRPGPWPKGSTHLRWRVGAPVPPSEPGSLEHFLTERYWLFTRRRGGVWSSRVHHEPWPLHEAALEHIDDSLVNAAQHDLVRSEPASVLAAPGVNVTGEPLRPLPAIPGDLGSER